LDKIAICLIILMMFEREFSSDLRKIREESHRLADELFEITMFDTKTLKTFLHNLLFLEKVKAIFENPLPKSLEPHLNQLIQSPTFVKTVLPLVEKEVLDFLKKANVQAEESHIRGILEKSLINKSDNRVVKRYRRILRVITHLFNTPLTPVALILNVDRETLLNFTGGEGLEHSNFLIEPFSWRDKILKLTDYFVNRRRLGLERRYLLTFFKGYMKLTYIFEVLNKESITPEERHTLAQKIGEPMVEITGGIINYKENLGPGENKVSLSKICSELKDILVHLLEQIGKRVPPQQRQILLNNFLDSVISLLVVSADTESIKFLDEEKARNAEKLRVRLAQLLIKRYWSESEEEKLEVYEGEEIWRDLLIQRLLCKNQVGILPLLGIPVINPDAPIDYQEVF